MDTKRKMAFYATALIGTALGTAAGLLLAPKSGEDTRKTIKRMAGELGEQFPSAHELRTRGRQMLSRAPELMSRRKERPTIQLYTEKED